MYNNLSCSRSISSSSSYGYTEQSSGKEPDGYEQEISGPRTRLIQRQASVILQKISERAYIRPFPIAQSEAPSNPIYSFQG